MVKRWSDNHSALFKSAIIEWGTPPDLFSALDSEFHFNFDACPAGGIWDGTYISWEGKRVFCNPPYGKRIGNWLAKGPEADLAVFLLPARTDTVWFHEWALKADEIRFIKGRLYFSKNHISQDHGFHGRAPFPSMLVVYGK
jgi:DNA N-6-adenine-methyltransferase (Dam)